MEQPFVSCLCLTYNRPPLQLDLLEEAVQSYLLQSYPADRRELLILNDTPGHRLTEDYRLQAKGVNVINIPRRFRTLGEKYAAAHGLARGNILLWWDDDDISLPWRVQRSVSKLLADSADYYNPGGYWYLHNSTLHHDHPLGYGLNCSAYTRAAYERAAVLGFGIDLDATLHSTFLGLPGVVKAKPEYTFTQWSYIYRWGVSRAHVSGHSGLSGGYDLRGQEEVVPGEYAIQPRWKQDYEDLVRAALWRIAQVKPAPGQGAPNA
jgi:glycosyltransferase involved in cell wall biosynthesis